MFWLLSVLLLSSATCWISEKCYVYEDASMIKNTGFLDCPTGNLTADCTDVGDVKTDLATLPPRTNSLCLGAARGLVLRPNALDRFSVLEQLYIRGCPKVIHSGAFAGLPRLRLISFNASLTQIVGCCSSSVSPNAFVQLPSLIQLSFNHYNISTMSTDVFSGLTDLKALRFHICGTEALDISCRIAELSRSLTSLYVGADETVTLRRQSCPRLDDAPMSGHFRALKSVSFVFPNLKYLGESAFEYFPEISFLNMRVNTVLKTQLLQSGVRSIATFEADLEQGGLGPVCGIAFELSVENLRVKLGTRFALRDNIGLEGCVGLRGITLASSAVQDGLRSIRALKNLRVLELDGEFSPRSLEKLCEPSDSASLLEKFRLNNSQLNKITRRQFCCLRNLSVLDLSHNNISTIRDFAFEGSDELQVSYLTDKSLLFLTDNQTGLRRLEYLDLSENKMSSVNFAVFEGLNSLKVLNLCSNRITRITADRSISPLGLASLERLDLRRNRIAYVDDSAFEQMQTLKTLMLDYNKISEISRLTFFGLERLESLMLEYNVVKYFQPSALSDLTSLRKFTLGCLRHLSSETAEVEINLGLLFGRIPVNLTELAVSSCSRPMTIVIGSESAPKPGLRLRIFGQRVRFLDCEKPFFLSVVDLTAVVKQLLCGSRFAGKYFRSLESFLLCSQVMSTFVDLVDLNTLLRLRKLEFVNVDLSDQPQLGTMLHNLTSLNVLALYKCRIPSFSEDLTKDLKSLKYLIVQLYNGLSVVETFPRPLLNLKYMFLINTVLSCSCDNAWFNEWARHQRQVQVITRAYYKDLALACQNMNGIQNFAKYTESSCLIDVEFVLFALTFLAILLFMLVVLVHNLAGDYLLAFIHIAHGWLGEAIRGRANRRYQYDVFVSYSGTDERWVVDELLPNLETRGPPFLRLCLHSRDFQLGVDIVENITASLYRSRHTLCLLSRHYLRSKWCSLEMKLATHRLLVENRDVLIVVFLEKISPQQLSAHHRLARVVKKKTYIDWPEEPGRRTAFWDRLWAKLAPEPARTQR